MAITKKYKGSTLPEVLVALAITSFCSTLAVVIYINIQKSTLPFIRIKAGELAEKYLEESLANKDYFDNAYTEEEYRITKTSTRNPEFTDCMDIRINVFDANHKKIAELQTTTHAN